jgi:hypothetical protein
MKELKIEKIKSENNSDQEDEEKSPLKSKYFFDRFRKTSGRHAAPLAL